MKVLVTPLDWGLGHATRSIPIIYHLLRQGHDVELASSGGALRLLQLEFPNLIFFELPPYQPQYAVSSNLLPRLLCQSKKFLHAIEQEHLLTEEIVKARGVQAIISDHRYGCHTAATTNIFVTHQVNFQFRGFWKMGAGIFNAWHHQKMSPFHHVWIPDLPGSWLSGQLSRNPLSNSRYIGLQSRFSLPQIREVRYDILVLLSGPEPQRSIFEQLMRAEISKTNFNVLMVKGQPGLNQNTAERDQITEVAHLASDQLQQAIEQSRFVVCRSGYSSVMDMARLKRRDLLFVATPGQPEQEYLARMLKAQGLVHSVSQHRISLGRDLMEASRYSGFVHAVEEDLLPQALASLHC